MASLIARIAEVERSYVGLSSFGIRTGTKDSRTSHAVAGIESVAPYLWYHKHFPSSHLGRTHHVSQDGTTSKYTTMTACTPDRHNHSRSPERLATTSICKASTPALLLHCTLAAWAWPGYWLCYITVLFFYFLGISRPSWMETGQAVLISTHAMSPRRTLLLTLDEPSHWAIGRPSGPHYQIPHPVPYLDRGTRGRSMLGHRNRHCSPKYGTLPCCRTNSLPQDRRSKRRYCPSEARTSFAGILRVIEPLSRSMRILNGT